MECHTKLSNIKADNSTSILKIALIGPANVGKSALFYQLTGKYVNICNYPGTTVDITFQDIEVKVPKIKDSNCQSSNLNTFIRVIDTPGINSVFDTSEDAFVALKVALESDFILFIGDAKNLKKLLNLVSGFQYLNKPYAIVLNMWDEAKTLGIEVDISELKIQSQRLIPLWSNVKDNISKVEVFPTIAVQGWGVSNVKNFLLSLPEVIDIHRCDTKSIHSFLKLLLSSNNISQIDFDFHFKDFINSDRIVADRGYFVNFLRESTESVDKIYKDIVKTPGKKAGGYYLFDKMTTHSVWGGVFAVLLLFIAYEFVGVFGSGTLVNLVENGFFNGMLNPFLKRVIEGMFGVNFVTEAFVGQYGIITMGFTYAFALVLPIMFTFFLFFSVLEDIGFFPRLTLFMNKILMLLGLKGRATLPLVLGFGCDTMATLTTRILPTRRERVLTTFILSLSIPCSAQLGVSLGILGKIGLKAIFLWIFILIISTIVPVFIANKLIFGRTKPLPFIMEIPPFRMPYISNILTKTFLKMWWYLKEAVPLFILGTFILYVFDKIGLLAKAQQVGGPVIKSVLGLPPEMMIIFILGFLRRDYGAAGLFALYQAGTLTKFQALASVVIITLFVPCFAQFLVTIKEFGYKVAITILLFNFFYAIGVGALLLKLNKYIKLL